MFSSRPHIKNLMAINNNILLSLDTFFDNCLSLFTVVDPSKGKKFKACEQFLSQIDSTGAYTACLEGKEADPAKQRRLVVKPHIRVKIFVPGINLESSEFKLVELVVPIIQLLDSGHGQFNLI